MVRVHEGHKVLSIDARDGTADAALSDGSRIQADHILLATGYKVDLAKLSMIAPALRDEIKAEMGIPVLGPSFETTAPGLYFVGATSVQSHGPIFRFVLGCRPAARRVARAVAQRQRTLLKEATAPRREPRGRLSVRPGPTETPMHVHPADEDLDA